MNTTASIEPNAAAHPDAQALTAIRQGEIERYRELIERYEKQVYAVAWCRLGDPDLAEEATQETFIKGYRYLAWLKDGSRFAGWIMAIARTLAINLGLRHRRELRKRSRWSLEIPTTSEAAGSTGEEAITAEMLRESLAELPAQHRECLTLFYLQGRSVAEAASALGVAEGAFKTRLHRARNVLRARLESRLAGALEQLRPPRSLAHGIMLLLPVPAGGAASGAAGGGLLAALGTTLGKALPTAWFISLLPLLGAIPGLGFAYYLSRDHQRNFRDPDGFRARLHRRGVRVGLCCAAGGLLLAFVLPSLGPSREWLWIGLLGVLVAISARQLVLNRSPAMIANFVTSALMLVILTARHWVDLGHWALPLGLGGLFLLQAFTLQSAPLRFDYSLFLRRSQGQVPDPASPPNAQGLSVADLFAFGRFLARHWLVIDYRRVPDAVRFRLTPVSHNALTLAFPIVWGNASTITIGRDGQVDAYLGATDASELSKLPGPIECGKTELEQGVATAVRQSLALFRSGAHAQASLALGEVAETEVFRVPVAKSRMTRWRRWLFAVIGAYAVLQACFLLVRPRLLPDYVQGRQLKSLTITAAEVQTALQGYGSDTNHDQRLWVELQQGLDRGVAFPPREWFSEAAQQRMRDYLLKRTLPGLPATSVADRLLDDMGLRRALQLDLVSLEALAASGLTSEKLRAALTAMPEKVRRRYLLPEEIEGVGRRYTVLELEWLNSRLQALRRFGCLDLVDCEAIVRVVVEHQVLPAHPLTGRSPDIDRGLWHGLFWLQGEQPLAETYQALACLELLGAVDKIDRSACIDGLLRFHHGQGRFGSIRRADGLFFRGDAQDTFYAWECLRRLDGLGRVKDLADWSLRPQSASQASGTGVRRPTWAEIQAVVVQGRMQSAR